MKNLIRIGTLLACAVIICVNDVSAASPAGKTLKIGDPAPKLQMGRWVQGEPVKVFEPGKAYIVEFWATWCKPCRAAIPNLNEIYIKFKDRGLVVIGQDCWEPDNTLVEPFIGKMGNQMTYRVALDNTNGAMAETWLAAAGQNGIPFEFLIDTKGVIAWDGFPWELQEETIANVLAGKYDIKQAAIDCEKAQKEVEAHEKKTAPAMSKISDMYSAINRKKWDEALDDLTAAKKLYPKDEQSLEISFNLDYYRILLGRKEYAAAYKLASKLSNTDKNCCPWLHNYLARQIVMDTTIEKPDLKLAEKLVRRAIDAAKGKSAAVLDTQARVLFMKGQKEEAVKAQAKAVKLADPFDIEAMKSRLDSYRKGELPAVNESWDYCKNAK